ncbi:MAG TPA: hypothetical protein VJK71_05705 [Gemmatimonadales bacterium]|nr:hypothetical protein [Gemmatimonadales bacterium]
MRNLARWGALTCAVVLGACSQDTSSPDAATPLLNADLIAVAADQVGEDVDIMREPVFFTAMPFGAGPVLAPATGPGGGDFAPPPACTYNTTTNRLECPPAARGNLTVTRSYAFWDGSGNPQDHYDPGTTARANVRTDVEGSRSHDGWSATVDRSRDMTATGLAGEETQRTWNGAGESHLTRSRHSDSGEERSYDLECNTTVTNVVVPVPRSDEHWPLSGSISIQCSITFVGGPRDGQTVERTVTITFTGTQTATATVGDRTFEIDLKTRRRTPKP